MASPQLEDGYTRIANELIEALAGIRLAGQEYQVVMAVIRLTYGYNKKDDAISFGQISTMTGIPRTKVIRTIQSLVPKKVLSSTNNGTRKPSTIGINKDYSKWVHSPKKGTSPNNGTKSSPNNGSSDSPNNGTHQRQSLKTERQVVIPPPPYCPHEQIVAIYHRLCPSLPRIVEWTDKRQTALRKRWTEKTERQSLGWWESFFAGVANSDFLMGRKVGRTGAFSATIDWILAPSNFVKILEGNYANRTEPRRMNGVVSEATERSMENAKRVLERLNMEAANAR